MKKRLLAALLCLIMIACLLPAAAFAAGDSAAQLGAGGIEATDKVYFGKYDNEPIYWRVKNPSADSVGLISEYVLFPAAYHSTEVLSEAPDLTYQTSELYTDTLPNFKNDRNNFSAAEAACMNDLGLPGNEGAATDRSKKEEWYWIAQEFTTYLRGTTAQWQAYFVASDGIAYPSMPTMTIACSVRPAFHLDASKVLFTSAADNSGQNAAFSEPAAYSGTEWKLTIKDGNSFAAGTAKMSGSTALTAGYGAETLTFSHAPLSSFTDAGYTNVTAALTNAAGGLLYYGSVNAGTGATSSSVTIPEGLAAGSYTLSLYAEDRNAVNTTDYATGTPFTQTITVAAAFTGLAANGSDTESTTALTLTFDQDVAGLAADDITVTGAAKGTLTKESGAGVYTLTISNITVADGGTVNVAVAKAGFPFTPANKDVTVRKYTAAADPSWSDPETVYLTTAGAGGTWTQGSPRAYSFTFNAPLSKFRSVRADGRTIAASGYTTASGSTVLSLKPEYLAALSVGTHTIRAIFSDGYAQTTFTIAEAVNPFADVKESDWFYNDVRYVYESGLFAGTSDTAFSPAAPMTRAMLVTVLWRMEGEPAVNYAMRFEDVAGGAYYAEAVRWAASETLVEGYGNGWFGASDPITREQLVTILHRYAVWKGLDVSVGEDTNILSYADAFDISEYAIGAFQWACGAGLIEGSDGKLMPQGGATRAQVAAILHRFLVEANSN